MQSLIGNACALWQRVVIGLFLALTTVAVYWPVQRFEFTNYDDGDYVYQNRQVQTGLTWRGVQWAFTTNHASNWFPLTWLSHMLDCQLWGENAGAHHLVNVFLHLASTLLLFSVLCRMTAAPWRSALVAALFALHPLRVESVAWVAERKDVLSAFCWMLTMWGYVRYVERPGPMRYCLALGCFALGLMAKPMVVTLPFVLLLLDYWPLGRTSWAKPVVGERAVRPLSVLLKEKLPFLVLSAASCAVTLWAQQSSITTFERLSLGHRLANATVSYVRYLEKAFWPADLAVFYPYQRWPSSTVLLAVAVLLSVSGLVVWRARRQPYWVTGWLWYLGTLVPVIGLVQVGLQSMADRYTYLPLTGVFLMLAWGVPDRMTATRTQKAIGASLAAGLLVACAVGSRVQLRYWKDSLTLFRRALEVTKNNYVALNNLSTALLQQGRLEEAIQHSRQALQVRPNFAAAHDNLGNALFQSGDVPKAIEHLRQAVQLKPDAALPHYNLGLALKQTGRLQEAIEQYEQALRLDPGYADAHNNLAVALAASGKQQEAIRHWEQTLRIKPEHGDARYNLGLALLQQGNLPPAIEQLKQAVRLKPDSAEAHNNLGVALLYAGRPAEAIEQFQQTLRLQPQTAEAHRNWGHALEQLGKLPEAIAQYEQALRIQPDHLGAHNDLGNAQLHAGKTREAITHFETALRIQPDDATTQNNLAWALATRLPSEGGDPARAVALAERACEQSAHRIAAHLDTLAAAYAAAGRFDEAVAVAEKAIELARTGGQPEVAAEIQSRLPLYRQGKPYRQPGSLSGAR
jgi:tetratricopeptide (TPR) repeat protein